MKLPVFICSLLLATVLAAPTKANPTNSEPQKGLQAHGTIKGLKPGLEDAKTAIKRLYDLHYRTEQKLKGYHPVGENAERIPHFQVAKDYGGWWKASRDVQHLILMGEPAAGDLAIRYSGLKVGSIAFNGIGSTAGQVRGKIKNALRKQAPRREKQLDSAQRKLAAGQLEAAERELEGIGVDLWSQAILLSPTERVPFVKRFSELIGDCDTKLNARRRSQYLQQAKQAMAMNLEATTFFNREAARIRGELSANGTAKIGANAQADAGDAIEYLTGLWGAASAGLLRNGGLYWAFSQNAGTYEESSSSDNSAEARKAIDDLESTAKSSFKGIIEAAASTAQGPDVRKLYAKVLDRLSVVHRRMVSFDFDQEIEPSLQKLAAQDPALPAQIAAYQRATAGALKWRKDFASKQARALSERYRSLESEGARKVTIEEDVAPGIYGRRSGGQRILLTPNFSGQAAWTVAETSTLLLKKPVSTKSTLRISPHSRTSVVPYMYHQYCNVAIGLDIQKQIDTLNTALIVDQEHPPLTLAAAGAISSAQLREFKSIGGEIQRIHLEAVVTRFITLPDGAYMLARLGGFPNLSDNYPPNNQTCWRLDIQPHWVQHEYFTHAVPVATK